MKFKKGDCIYCDDLYGEIIDVNNFPLEKYIIKWYDGRPETTTEIIERVDSYGFYKISRNRLLALAL